MKKLGSILLFVAFSIVSATGLAMAFKQRSKNKPVPISEGEAVEAKEVVVGKPFYPRKAHEWVGYFFVAAGLMHIISNKMSLLRFFKMKSN